MDFRELEGGWWGWSSQLNLYNLEMVGWRRGECICLDSCPSLQVINDSTAVADCSPTLYLTPYFSVPSLNCPPPSTSPPGAALPGLSSLPPLLFPSQLTQRLTSQRDSTIDAFFDLDLLKIPSMLSLPAQLPFQPVHLSKLLRKHCVLVVSSLK